MGSKTIENLKKAVLALNQSGKSRAVMSRYNSAGDLAKFIQDQILPLQNASLAKEKLHELWLIFAPTSDFDEYCTDIKLSEEIFQELTLLRQAYGPKAIN